MSMNYDPQHPPPSGQGYYGSHPRQPPRDYRSQSPRGTEYTSWPGQQSSSRRHRNSLPPADTDRGSETSVKSAGAQNQLAPYDDEKAWAEWNRAYGPEPTYPPVEPALPQDSRRRERRRPREERRRRHSYSDDDYFSPERRPPPRHHRRRDSNQSLSDYERKPDSGAKDLAPTLVSTAAGAFLGHKLVSKGALGAVGGAIAGAIGANAGEHFGEKKKRKDQQRSSSYSERDDGRRRVRREDHFHARGSHAPRSRFEDESPAQFERTRTQRPKRYVRSGSESYMSV